jgi:hypothetical protein
MAPSLLVALLVAATALPSIPSSFVRLQPSPRPLAVVKGDRSAPPPATLVRYEAAIAAFHTPAIMTFEYQLEQAGERNIAQTHRIYRSERLERDETISTGDTKITQPKIRIYRSRSNPYALESLAPRRAAYLFTYVGRVADGRHTDYRYRVRARVRGAGYTVTSVVIDGHRFVPVSIEFTTNAASVTGSGRLRFGDMNGGWVVSEIEASASVGKSLLRERIVLRGYRFPRSLPPSTFGG